MAAREVCLHRSLCIKMSVIRREQRLSWGMPERSTAPARPTSGSSSPCGAMGRCRHAGIVFNPNYLVYADNAMTEYARCGLSYPEALAPVGAIYSRRDRRSTSRLPRGSMTAAHRRADRAVRAHERRFRISAFRGEELLADVRTTMSAPRQAKRRRWGCRRNLSHRRSAQLKPER